MADYRQIYIKMWKDTWFLELPADSKLLFVYLFSNESTSVAGIYELPIPAMAFETGLSIECVKESLAHFREAGKVYYENGIVWVVNLRKYNANPSPKVDIRIEMDLDDLPDCELKRKYLEFYSTDTVSIPHGEHEQEQEQEHEQEQGEDGGTPPPTPPPGIPDPTLLTVTQIRGLELPVEDWRALMQLEKAGKKRNTALRFMRSQLNPMHPAVKVYRAIAETTPQRAIRDEIAEIVGTEEADLNLWGDVVKGCLLRGWKPYNVGCMLDHYKRREIPTNGRKAGPAQPATTQRFRKVQVGA